MRITLWLDKEINCCKSQSFTILLMKIFGKETFGDALSFKLKNFLGQQGNVRALSCISKIYSV